MFYQGWKPIRCEYGKIFCPQPVDTNWAVWQASNNVAGCLTDWLTDWVRRDLEMHSHLKGEVGEGGGGGGGADQQPGGQVGEAWSLLSWAGWWLWTTRQQKKTVVPVRIDSVRNPGFWNITRMFVLGRKVFSELWGAYYSSGRAHTEKKNTIKFTPERTYRHTRLGRLQFLIKLAIASL